MVVTLTLLASSAWALQSTQSGPLLELGVGGGLGSAQAVGTGQLTLGWWRGRYDDDYALGRFTAFLVTQQLDLGQQTTRYSPMAEVRRSVDLFVVAPWYGVAAGPLVANGTTGAAIRAVGGLKFRRSRKAGFTARLAGGLDVLDGRVHPAVALTLGVGWSSPIRRND